MREVYEALDIASSLMARKTPCSKGNGNCCVRAVDFLPSDRQLFEEGIDTGNISSETVDAAVARVQEDNNICPFLDEGKACSIYKFRPLACRAAGIGGIPLTEDIISSRNRTGEIPAPLLDIRACGDCRQQMKQEVTGIPSLVVQTIQQAYTLANLQLLQLGQEPEMLHEYVVGLRDRS